MTSTDPSHIPSGTAAPAARESTAIDRIAEDYFDRYVALRPVVATVYGVPGHDGEMDDLSPAGLQAAADLRREALAALDGAPVADDVDAVTVSAMRERLGLANEIHDAGLEAMQLNVLSSPLQGLREIFDLMPTETDEQWDTLAERLGRVVDGLAGYRESLRWAADRGLVTPQRQAQAGVEQCEELVGPESFFAGLPRRAEQVPGVSTATVQRLSRAADAAMAGYADFAQFIRQELLPVAPAKDACGLPTYQLWSRYFLGATVDLPETYRWGLAEVDRIDAQMRQVAEQIRPGASVLEAMDHLDADPAYRLEGTDALQAWMQDRADEAITNLADHHFDIPEPVRTIECRIAPTTTGGIYYTSPNDDFSRPGRMWWSVPKGVTTFGTWRELTTVYHEGVPGHHLQVGQTTYRRELLNRWRRQDCWASGHGEGWALYAEQLMADLGYLDDPGMRMGLLASQALRASRVVIDIGVHCELPAPAEVGGGDWTYDKAWAYLTAHSGMDEMTRRFELDRYLGWPGQAPSYKVGQRLWEQLRDEVARRQGESFSLKAFHRRALDVGGVGLDTLREAMLR